MLPIQPSMDTRSGMGPAMMMLDLHAAEHPAPSEEEIIEAILQTFEATAPPPAPASFRRRAWILLNTDVRVLWSQFKSWWRSR